MVCCTLLSAAVLIAFGGLLDNDFIRYDDTLYVLDNPHVRAGLSPEGLRWAATARAAANWHPLTWVSHMIDVELFGLRPGGHHLSSLVLHLINGLLLYVWLRWTTASRWRSAFVAGLFALHPLHVESVSWIAERKDVLSTMLLLLTLLAWTRYARSRRSRDYALSMLLFALGLAAKPMLVTLPLLLLLLDVWPLGRTSLVPAAHPVGRSGSTVSPLRLVAEKLPLLALSVASSVMTLVAQQGGGALKDTVLYPLSVRLATAVVAYAAYVVKALVPVGLNIFYLHPRSWPG
ncbi:MAG: glycosyltransferase family 39 protein, partial [Rhodothermales bacterium]